MSDSLNWIDGADIKRINRLLTRSADVVATAREELEEHHAPANGQPLGDLQGRELLFRPATQRQVTSAQRRELFRHLLRTPKLNTVATSSKEAVRTSTADTTRAKDLKTRIGSTSSSANPKRRSSRLGGRSADAPLQHEEIEEAHKRDGQLNRHRRHRNEETSAPTSLPNSFSSMLISWTQRLDYLTNVVIGVLATALVISLFVRAEQSDPYRDVLPLVANAKTSGDQQAIIMASEASLYPAQGFNILPKEFREPLPTFAEDIFGLLLLAAPLPAAPGITVLPYTGLPQALPGFPEDIAQLVMIASSPGPDERDYLIRTLVFEASGETEIGKFAVAYAILNRKRSGRWGRRIADVVTSPWQFEPWMTRKNEIEELSRTDPRYLEAAEIADAVLAGHIPDPTAGATHFLNPVIVRERRQGSLPSWADNHGRPIGRHVFYCPECNGTKPKRAAAVEAGEVKGIKATPTAANRVKPTRVGQTVAAEAPADVGKENAAPAVLRHVAEKPEAVSKPKLTTQRRRTNLPWLKPTQAMQRAAVVEAGEAKGSEATPAAADRVKPTRVGQTVVAEARADSGAAKAAPAVLRTAGEKPAARSKPKLKTQRRRTNPPWLKPTKARQRRNFVPNIFW